MNEEEPEKRPSKADMDFVHLFEEMADLLQYSLENAEGNIKVPLPKNLETQMAKLENDIDEFCRINAAIVAKQEKSVQSPLDMPKREKEVFDRSKNLVSKAEEKIAALKDFLQTAASQGMDVESSPEQLKKQFKKFSLREKWKKM